MLSKVEHSQIFDCILPHPTVALAAEGTARLKAFRPDLLAALGGQSAIDCAKAIACFAQGDFPLVVIPTDSGSGSEVTNYAVLTHGQSMHPLVDDRLYPDAAILDIDLLTQMSKSQIADGGFDILTHALESYVAKRATPLSDILAREAFSAAFACLPASYAGHQEVRLRVHLASIMAGISYSHTGLGLCHALSHSLEGLFQIPHGRVNAVLLPAVIDCNAHAAASRYAQIARAAGMGGSSDAVALRNLKSGIVRIRKDLELPQTLRQLGIPPGKIWNNLDEIINAVLCDPCAASNPMPAEEFLIRRILEASISCAAG